MTQKICTLPLATLEAYKQIAQSYCHACAFDAADPMYSSAIKSKCLEGIRILRTNLVLI